MLEDTVIPKKSIFDIRKDVQGSVDEVTAPLLPFMQTHGFYPSVFYNENDINDSFRGVRQAIPDLDDYEGIFVWQDSPDTPISKFNGIEFRTSLTNSVAQKSKQLLWTVQNLSHLERLPVLELNETPEVQFAGTLVWMQDGRIFPQQVPRTQGVYALGTSGLITEIHLRKQVFTNNGFESTGGLNEREYFDLMEKYPYGLSVRGWGNWNLRFYELIASGRIPVHVHTDDQLLFEREIPWDDLIVRVTDLAKIGQAVEDFHSQFTDRKSLAAHCKKLYDLYREYLSFPAFCQKFEDYYADDIARMSG